MVSSPDMQKVVQQIFKATHEILLPEKDPKLDVKSHVIKAKAFIGLQICCQPQGLCLLLHLCKNEL